MKKFAIILAGGEGHRHGGDMPKQFVEIAGYPVLWWSMKRFYDEDPSTSIVVVMHPGFFDDWDIINHNLSDKDRIPHVISCGGISRGDSVANGLKTIKEIIRSEIEGISEEEILVAVHDAARPMVPVKVITRGWKYVKEGVGSVPVVYSTSSLRMLLNKPQEKGDFHNVDSEPIDRSMIVEVQTPQVFTLADLDKMYKNHLEEKYTDDAGLAQSLGIRIALFEGSTINFKITNPEDSKIASFLISQSS